MKKSTCAQSDASPRSQSAQHVSDSRKLLTRLLKTLRQPSAGFALLGAHQVGAVPEFPSILCSNFLGSMFLWDLNTYLTRYRITGGPSAYDLIIIITIIIIIMIMIIIIIDSMISVFNTDASLPYNRDLSEILIVKKRIKWMGEGLSASLTQSFRGHGVGPSLFTPLRIGHGKQYSLRQTMVRHT
ncbi:hypothetical protein T265_03330 [Opisthorchis viverrini]|uniref:Uncharacterized protein n=1 Tax=Opisthorchis viverrini TaxID=6198 RepID=A0A074ZS13_OPIVI|nr:hypothetical protein T265_03330 [Opisthorchis viverrini]KER30173.1 hypothetical protein T265_03330 [Opisthorchis viverrini]